MDRALHHGGRGRQPSTGYTALTPLDLQAIVDEQDRTLNPYARYLPSLPGMGYTVETPQIDPASALSHARAPGRHGSAAGAPLHTNHPTPLVIQHV